MRKNPPFPAPYPPNLRTYPPSLTIWLYERRISAKLAQESAISSAISAKFVNLSANRKILALRKKDIRQVCEFIRQS
ncbi:hypothetical protein [Ureibacillus sp. FSL W7-1570]|uniref:hypothetical protein n=1 Tax=Ureibacillus sp. FSL W7-1570 TaxID=2954593 RepID=UPI00315B163C